MRQAPTRRTFLRAVGGTALLPVTVASCVGGTSTDGPIAVGDLSDIRATIADRGGRARFIEFGGFLIEVDDSIRAELAASHSIAAAGLEVGLLAVSHTCPHQGCRVGTCGDAGWFECPCHNSRFNELGEIRRGPASRGLDVLAVAVDGTTISVDPTVRSVGLVESSIGSADTAAC